MVGWGFVDHITIWISWRGVLPRAEKVRAVPGPQVGGNGTSRLTGIVGLAGSPGIDICAVPPLPHRPDAVTVGVEHEKQWISCRIAGSHCSAQVIVGGVMGGNFDIAPQCGVTAAGNERARLIAKGQP